jgi:hypothetical protein
VTSYLQGRFVVGVILKTTGNRHRLSGENARNVLNMNQFLLMGHVFSFLGSKLAKE